MYAIIINITRYPINKEFFINTKRYTIVETVCTIIFLKKDT